MQLNTYNNSWYHPGANKLVCIIWYITNAVFFDSYLMPISSIKVSILRLFGCTVGQGVVIKPKVNIKYPWNITIGNCVWIGEEVWLDSLATIEIKDHVCISQGAYLLTGNHNYKKQSFDLMVLPITLETGSWIGAKSVVCPGVHCATNAILTAGSIATKNLEANTIYQGNPAEKIRMRY
jgi:putative colanic acid biosynthesis acetyltransferase WcaF